jgi:hypothetical protein
MSIEDQRQAIRCRAHAIWEQEGQLHGSDWAHWFQAEAEAKLSLLGHIRDAMFLANRAFVFLQKIEWKFVGNKATHTITKWRFIPAWQNNGNTPTRFMTNRVNFAAFEHPIDLGFDFPELGDPQVGHTTIGPRAVMHAAHIDVSAEVLERVNNREAHAYIWGWADYNDILPGTSRHRTEFCFEIIVHGNPRAEDCQFLFRQLPQHNGIDNECLREPRSGGAVAYYKFLDAADVDKVLINNTLIVSSFEYFRKLEAAQWGTIADPLEAASELTVKGSFVIREDSPELEVANKANIGLGMFQTFAKIHGGGIIDISETRFIHTVPNLFVFSASVGNINDMTVEMCVKAERPYDACLRIMDIGALRKRIFDAGRIPEMNCKVSEIFEPGLIRVVEYEARSRDIREGETIVPSPFKKDMKFKHQSEVRILGLP